jgi:hypothetical protein
MSIGLPNSKFSGGQPLQRLGVSSRQYKVAPSIAEGAIFIPKPHERVAFKLKVNGGGDAGQPMPTLGQGNTQPVQLLGSGNSSGQAADPATGLPTGKNIASGNFGANGLTARLDQAAWKGQPGGQVVMEIKANPTKERGSKDPIPTQEEGRQVNNRQINFTQQYDSYGRPRIGFSREPYDFAATKFVSVTNQIAFQANMAAMHSSYDSYLLSGKGSPTGGQPSTQTGTDPTQSNASGVTPQAGSDVASQQAGPVAAGQGVGTGNAAENTVGGANAAQDSPPAVVGQGASGVGANEIPIFGSTSDKPSDKTTGNAGGADAKSDKVTAKESFDMQKTKPAETSEHDGDSDNAKKATPGGKVGATYGNSAGQDAKSGSLNVAV